MRGIDLRVRIVEVLHGVLVAPLAAAESVTLTAMRARPSGVDSSWLVAFAGGAVGSIQKLSTGPRWKSAPFGLSPTRPTYQFAPLLLNETSRQPIEL